MLRGVRNLDQVDSWPVEKVGVGVTTPAETTAVHGSVSESFNLASVTKLLSAYGLLIAIEEGTLNIDDPVGPKGSSIRHLLAHASGMGPEGNVLAAAGQRRIYSNAGFDLLGNELELKAEMPFSSYISEALFEPLGMSSARIEGSPAFGGVASVEDLLIFARELMTPTLIATETLEEATSLAFGAIDGVLPGYGKMSSNDWGLGFEIRSNKEPHWTSASNSPETFGHFGAAGTFLWVDPRAQISCVCLTNRDFGDWAHTLWPALSESVLAAAI